MNDPRDDGGRVGVQVSVVLPAYNERENLAELLPETRTVLEQTGLTHEIIVVDDGSTDGTRELMRECPIPGLVSIRFRRNAGKSAALDVGLARAQGEYIVLMDADGQDDPREIPRLIAALERGDELDLVTGRRSVRHDRVVKRTTSRLYNRATSMVTGVSARDFNSGLKVMRRDLAQGSSSTASCTGTSRCWRTGAASGSARSTSSTTPAGTVSRSSGGPASGEGSSTSSR